MGPPQSWQLVDGTIGEHFIGCVETLKQLGQNVEVTLALGGFDHAEGFSAKLLPFLALGFACRFGSFNNDRAAVGLLAVVGFPCSQLSGGHVGGD